MITRKKEKKKGKKGSFDPANINLQIKTLIKTVNVETLFSCSFLEFRRFAVLMKSKTGTDSAMPFTVKCK